MSFDDRQEKYIDIEDIDIKSHLNTSLEAEGISVSEDLIKRTLEAINKQKDKERGVEKSFVFPLRQVRTLVAVAAAFLVLVVGFKAIGILGPGGVKSDNIMEDDKSYDMDGGAVNNKESESKNDIFVYDMAEDSAELIMGSDADQVDEELDDNRQELANNKMFTAQNYGLTFTEMSLISPDNVKSISISSADNNETMVITEQEQIKLFYSIMDSYSYQQSAEQDANIQLVIDIIGDDIDSQIIISQSAIFVGHTSKDTASHSIFSASGQSELIEDIRELMNE